MWPLLHIHFWNREWHRRLLKNFSKNAPSDFSNVGDLLRSKFDLCVIALHQCRDTVNLQLGPQSRRKPLFLLFTSLQVTTGLDGACHAWQYLQTQLSELCSRLSAVRCVMSFMPPPRETGSLAPSPQQSGVQVEWQLHAGSLTWFPCLDTDLWGLTMFCGRLACSVRYSATVLASAH